MPNAVKHIFQPVTDAEKEAVKNKYTEGRNILYTQALYTREKNLMNLLKAFSIFKRKQKSNWKLVLAGRLAWKYKSFIESLKSYNTGMM
ncbi:MAG: glycosyltransferase [Bacteroidota bacterium]